MRQDCSVEATVEVKHNQGTMPPTGRFVGGGVFASFFAGKKKGKRRKKKEL
jgi:hypothetical protein